MKLLVAGASRGLGLEIVKAAAAAGHEVVASRRGKAPLLEEVAAHYPSLKLVTFDVTDETAIEAAAKSMQGDGRRLTHIVNNAGVLMGRGDGATAIKASELTESFVQQALGPALVVKHFLPLLDDDTGIQILNVSSESGSMSGVGGPDYAYGISKCALNMYTAMLRKELEPRGVGVAAIHPGWIRTDMGGPNAPGDPAEAAASVLKLLTGETPVASGAWFINLDGSARAL